MQLLRGRARGFIERGAWVGLAAVLGLACGRATDAPAASTGAAGAGGGRVGSGGGAGAAGAGSRTAAPIRWMSASPPGFEGFGIDSNWEAGPSIGRDTECLVHVARDPAALTPRLTWTALAGGVERSDPRLGLGYSDLSAVGADDVGGKRTAVSRVIVGEREGVYAHWLHMTTDLRTGQALALLHSWEPILTDLPSTCGFGVSRPSARLLDVVFSPRNKAPSERINALVSWEPPSIAWTPFFDPWVQPKEAAALGPAPHMLLSVGGNGGAIGPLDPQLPTTPLSTPTHGQSQQGHSLVAYGNRGVWVEDLGDRDRIRSYSKADGVKTEHTFADSRVRSVVFDGERISGAMQTRLADPRDAANQLRVWTQDPATKAVSFSPAYVSKKLTGPAPLKAAGHWAVLGAFTGEVAPKPGSPGQKAPMLSDGSLQLVLAVNLITWQAHRIPIPPGQVILADGLGVDDAFIYVSLRADDINSFGVRELRRYPVARVAEWGTPWTPE